MFTETTLRQAERPRAPDLPGYLTVELSTFQADEQIGPIKACEELGGDVPRWTHDGGRIIFRRDVHEGEGARYVPFVYDVESGAEFPLWPALPDSVPQFPSIDTQNPVEIPFP